MSSERYLFLILIVLALTTLATGVDAVDVYFSPGSDCENHLVEAISNAKKEVHAAIFMINNPRIVHALVEASIRGVQVKILTDKHQAEDPNSRVEDLKNAAISVHLHNTGKLEHNTFAVIDGALAMNGSFNWSSAATTNSENCAFMPEKNAVASFEGRFQDLWKSPAKSRIVTIDTHLAPPSP